MNNEHNLAVDYQKEDDAAVKKNISYIKRPAKSLKKNLGIAVGLVILLALVAVAIAGRVEISELYAQRAALETKLTKIQDENIDLEGEITEKTGMTKVEEYAENKLGLHKLDKSQIEYVEIEENEKADVVKNDETNVFVKIKRWFSSAMEYIGLE